MFNNGENLKNNQRTISEILTEEELKEIETRNINSLIDDIGKRQREIDSALLEFDTLYEKLVGSKLTEEGNEVNKKKD